MIQCEARRVRPAPIWRTFGQCPIRNRIPNSKLCGLQSGQCLPRSRRERPGSYSPSATGGHARHQKANETPVGRRTHRPHQEPSTEWAETISPTNAATPPTPSSPPSLQLQPHPQMDQSSLLSHLLHNPNLKSNQNRVVHERLGIEGKPANSQKAAREARIALVQQATAAIIEYLRSFGGSTHLSFVRCSGRLAPRNPELPENFPGAAEPQSDRRRP